MTITMQYYERTGLEIKLFLDWPHDFQKFGVLFQSPLEVAIPLL